MSKITYNKKNPSAYLSAAAVQRTIAALGSADGVLRILYVGGTAEDVAVKCIYRCKIANGAITSLLYHPQKPLLAAVSLSERQVFSLTRELTKRFVLLVSLLFQKMQIQIHWHGAVQGLKW